jgi:hypothetical protein
MASSRVGGHGSVPGRGNDHDPPPRDTTVRQDARVATADGAVVTADGAVVTADGAVVTATDPPALDDHSGRRPAPA